MRVIFHIGYSRTGTTFLQKIFLKKMEHKLFRPQILSRDSKPFFSYEKMYLLIKLMLKIYKYWKCRFPFKDLSLSEDKVNLISSENFDAQLLSKLIK